MLHGWPWTLPSSHWAPWEGAQMLLQGSRVTRVGGGFSEQQPRPSSIHHFRVWPGWAIPWSWRGWRCPTVVPQVERRALSAKDTHSVSHTLTHTYTLMHTHIYTHTHIHTLIHSHTHSYTHSYTHTLTLTLILLHSLSHTHAVLELGSCHLSQ